MQHINRDINEYRDFNKDGTVALSKSTKLFQPFITRSKETVKLKERPNHEEDKQNDVQGNGALYKINSVIDWLKYR